MNDNRAWRKMECDSTPGSYYWRCAPWTIGLFFLDGCSMYVLSRDGNPAGLEYCEDLTDAMQRAKKLEAKK